MKRLPIEMVTCTGSHYEMGRAQGLWLRPRREETLNSLLKNDFTPAWIQKGGVGLLKVLFALKGLSMRWGHVPNLHRFTPLQFERMKGIADGAGLSLNQILGIANIENMSASFQFVLGCTSIGVGSKKAKEGRPLIAYNHDFPNFLRDHIFVRRSRPRKGLESIQITYPSLPGAIAGINEAGVAITLNHAFSKEPANNGVPPTMLVQEALDRCRDAGQVKQLFSRAKFACGSMVTVIDTKGGLFALELARNRFGVRMPEKGLSLTLNDYCLSPLREIEVPQEAKFDPKAYPPSLHGEYVHKPNWNRRRRFAMLLKKMGRLGPSDLKRYLSDHSGLKRGGIETICRHHPITDTIATAILYPRERKIEVSRGYACQATYQIFSL